MYKQYIVGFMMIEGIVLELDVKRIQLGLIVSPELINRLPKLVKFN